VAPLALTSIPVSFAVILAWGVNVAVSAVLIFTVSVIFESQIIFQSPSADLNNRMFFRIQ
jgi:hypothetical protein